MVRTVNTKYNFLLAGYYDDFVNARAVPEDANTPSTTTSYDPNDSYAGNLMNGEATLNPRYRWCIADRERLDTGKTITTTLNQYLKNSRISDWLTVDASRQQSWRYEGRAQLQYPDGHIPTKTRFGNGANNTTYKNTNLNGGTTPTTLGYQRFCNGYDTSGSYVVAVGEEDSTFRRNIMQPFNTDVSSGSDISGTHYGSKIAGVHDTGWYTTTATTFQQYAHLAGVWMGETLAYVQSYTPENLFAPVKSPGGKPFLVVQSYRKSGATGHSTSGQHAGTPQIAYDGSLNSRLDKDCFTARVCIRSFYGNTDDGTNGKIAGRC